LTPIRYDCLGCEVCYPPLAMSALGIEDEACPAGEVEERAGWPPLPGEYAALRYHAPVAVCTLTDGDLAQALVRAAGTQIAIVGTVFTENLGIERVLSNILANSNIRFLIACGADSRQAIGHMPGQSLLALARSGVDERMRIIGARGKRPFLKNLTLEAVEHFRATVEVVDRIGSADLETILATVAQCARDGVRPAPAFSGIPRLERIRAKLPDRMVSDPAGYFVIYVNHRQGELSLEHYRNDGVLDLVIEGTHGAELACTAIDRGLLTRMDHAAYLGRELIRAERSLVTGEPFVQDAAPEARSNCECAHACEKGGI
jgi:tetrahydromethanopterin S-methyltransferase subunit A